MLPKDHFYNVDSQGIRFKFGLNSTNDSLHVANTLAVLQNVVFADNNVEKYVVSIALGTIMFMNCSFENNTGTAIQADASSKLIFEGVNVFRNNSALVGAGIQLLESTMHLQPHSSILFEDNHADHVGGAIFVDIRSCFFQAEPPTDATKVIFVNNTADFAGSSLYAAIEPCCSTKECRTFYNIFNTSNSEEDPSAIAYDPSLVLCAFVLKENIGQIVPSPRFTL